MALITVNDYAKSRKSRGLAGGTRQAVDRAVKAGRITLLDGRIDPAVADIQWEANTRKCSHLHSQERQPPAPPAAKADPSDWSTARARRESAQAETAEIELRKLKGELVDRAGVERAAMQTYRTVRDTLDALPARLAPELAGLAADAWAIECRLREAIRQTLAAVVGKLREEAARKAPPL